MSEKRPSIRIHLRYDMETGEFDLIVDDNAPDMPEEYHDKVAQMIAGYLSRNPQIEDAGLRHIVWGKQQLTPQMVEQIADQDEEDDKLVD